MRDTINIIELVVSLIIPDSLRITPTIQAIQIVINTILPIIVIMFNHP